MFFESLAECCLGFTYVCVAAVDVTRDVINGSTLKAWQADCLHLPVSSTFDDGMASCVCP